MGVSAPFTTHFLDVFSHLTSHQTQMNFTNTRIETLIYVLLKPNYLEKELTSISRLATTWRPKAGSYLMVSAEVHEG